MSDYTIFPWDGVSIKSVVDTGFLKMETQDHIVGIIYADPSMVKRIILAIPDEVFFDYIPEGVGLLRTAYLKMRPMPYDSEIRFVSRDNSIILRALVQ
jgi:hypothetical protein